MRIAVVAPPWYEVPPRGYGGIESVCASLVDGLVDRGHDVTLIAAGKNGTRARFVQTFPSPPPGLGEPNDFLPEMIHAARAARALETLEVDVVHDHSAAGALTAFGRRPPTVVTAHLPVEGLMGEYYRSLPEGVSLVGTSESQRRANPALPWARTVHNAIPLAAYPFQRDKERFALFLGRMSPEKGPHVAIDAARAVGWPIVLAGRCTQPTERAYFERRVDPLLGADAAWIDEVDLDVKQDLLARAGCLLFPIQWEEPFGMVMIEAMACGTPVVALRRGSVPEIVVDHVTGVICDHPEDLPAGIEEAAKLDPGPCRDHVAANFDIPTMAAGYEAVYEEARQLAALAPRGTADPEDRSTARVGS
jgi:glycosyltransferase involved in cell wall biosynthesis